jgi:hypothetical protein
VQSLPSMNLRVLSFCFRLLSAGHLRGVVVSGLPAMRTMNLDVLLHFDFQASFCFVGKESDG